MAGVAALLLRLATGFYCLRRLSGRSENVADADLQEQVHLLWLAGGCGVKPRVCESAEITVPLTLGIWEPVVVLPVQWRQWDRAKREAVLLHEMTHVERNDTSSQIFASLATCFYWFHPLAWILKGHLALLAEQACDERVVRSVNPERYAGVLIEIARDLQLSGSLFAPVASMPMVKSSQLKSRLERVLSATPAAASGHRILRLALLICLPALAYLSAAGHLERQVVEQNPQTANSGVVNLSARAAELGAQLASDPTNSDIRSKLLLTYYKQMQEGDTTAGEKHDTQLLWLIANHPDAAVLGRLGVADPTRQLPNLFQPHYQEAEDLWTSQLSRFPDSPAVLANASTFFHEADAPRAFELIKKARQLDPEEIRYLESLAGFYAQAEIDMHIPALPKGREPSGPGTLGPALIGSLHQELVSSTDAALLSDVGSRLVRISQGTPLAQTGLPAFGKQLMDRAAELEPANPQLKEAIATANLPQPNVKSLAGPPGTVSIGPKVMERGLMTKVDPVYPPLALQARIQGSVVFNVLIDKDGSIEKAQLASGHPLLVNAAREALMQYRYSPTRVNADPVPVITQVSIRFSLPANPN